MRGFTAVLFRNLKLRVTPPPKAREFIPDSPVLLMPITLARLLAMKNIPRVSVIIPTYNREDTIAEAAMSVLEQSFQDLELVIVDDHSSDATLQKVFELNDPRIVVSENPKKGVSSARNHGVDISRPSQWIAFHDSDDVWLPTKLERQLARLEGSDFVAAYCGMVVKTDVSPDSPIQKRYPNEKNVPLEGNILPSLLKNSFISTQMLVVRRDIFAEVGGFDEKLNALVDWELMIRVAQRGPVAFVDEDLVVQRMSPNSITNSRGKRTIAQEYIFQKHKDLLSKYPDIAAWHHHRLAGAYRIQGDLETAAVHARKALKTKPYSLRYFMGNLAIKKKALFQ